MNKKLKRMLATVSAVAMCTISMTAISSNASVVYVPQGKITAILDENVCYSLDIPLDAISFNTENGKYVLWEEATEYEKVLEKNNYEDIKIYKKEGSDGSEHNDVISYIKSHAYRAVGCGDQLYGTWGLFNSGAGESTLTKEQAETVKKYLDSKNIEYSEFEYHSDFDSILTTIKVNDEDNRFAIYLDVLENTGIIPYSMCFREDTLFVNSVEVLMPEPTLSGDTNEDGKVSLADAVLIMQALSNPDEYQITPQGIANADMDGDGLTPSDALKIQQSVLNS